MTNPASGPLDPDAAKLRIWAEDNDETAEAYEAEGEPDWVQHYRERAETLFRIAARLEAVARPPGEQVEAWSSGSRFQAAISTVHAMQFERTPELGMATRTFSLTVGEATEVVRAVLSLAPKEDES